MRPGYYNFRPVDKDEVLAMYDGLPVRAETDGLILMPLYHNEGHDGYFIVRQA